MQKKKLGNPTVISFDIGNTLINLGNNKGFCTYFSEQIGVELSEIRDLLDKYFLCTNYAIDVAVKKVCQIVGYGFPQEILDGFVPTKVKLFNDVIPVLKILKMSDVKIIAFSNCTPWEANGLGEYGLNEYISKIYYSHNIGMVKPDIKSFQYVQNDIGVQANEILHIGDTLEADVKGALAAGWNACLLDRTLKSFDEEKYMDITVINNLNDLIMLLDYTFRLRCNNAFNKSEE